MPFKWQELKRFLPKVVFLSMPKREFLILGLDLVLGCIMVFRHFFRWANLNYQTIDPKIKYTTAWVPEISADHHFAKLTKTDWYVGTSVGYCFWESDDAIDYNSGCAYSSYNSEHR